MKKIIVFAAAAMLAASVQAQKVLDIRFKDGQHQQIKLADNPQMTNNGTNWVVTATGFEAQYTYPEVDELTVADTPSGMEMVEGNAGISYENKVLTVTAAPGTRVTVATIGGVAVKALAVPAGGTVSVDMSALPKGTYVVAVNKKAFKILN